jgi:SAM-dependent methyltransferase
MFDVVTGFNSFQYAANPAVALREARRVTKAEGVIVIMTWGMPEGMQAAALVAALRPLLPPPPGAPGPFALSDEVTMRAFAVSAGLTPVEVFDVESPWLYPNEATAVRGLNSSGVSARAMENSNEEAVSEAHRQALKPFRLADGSYRCVVSMPPGGP